MDRSNYLAALSTCHRVQGGATVVHNPKVSWRRHRSGRTRCPALAPSSTLELCWGFHVPAVAELAVSEYKSTLSITQFLRMASLESCEQEASLSTSFDTPCHAYISFLASKKNSFPPKKMRWIGVVVASQNVAPKAVRALVMFLAIACCQLTVGSSNLSVLAGKVQVSYSCYNCP